MGHELYFVENSFFKKHETNARCPDKTALLAFHSVVIVFGASDEEYILGKPVCRHCVRIASFLVNMQLIETLVQASVDIWLRRFLDHHT